MVGHPHVDPAVALPAHVPEDDALVRPAAHHLAGVSCVARQEPHRCDARAVVVKGRQEAVVLARVEHVDESVPGGGGQVALGAVGRIEAVLEAEDLGIMGLDLAELVHELELVDPDVAGPVAAGQMLPVGADPDAPHTVPLVVQRVLLPGLEAGVRLLDEAELGVDVEGLEQLLAVDVPPVQGVGRHLGVHVPDPDRVVRAAGDEAAGREDGLLAVTEGSRVGLKPPDAGRVVEE